MRVTASHVAGGEIQASYLEPDRAEYVRSLRSLLASTGVTLTEEPDQLVATFRFSGRTLTIKL